MEYLNSLSPVARAEQAHASAADALLRMEYELVIQRTLAAENNRLSSKVEAQNAELEKLKAEIVDMSGLKEKLAKCKELSERLALAEKWRGRIKENLDLASQSLDQASDVSTKICEDVTRMLAVHDKLVSENEQVIKVVMEDMDRFERVLDAAKVYKLRSER